MVPEIFLTALLLFAKGCEVLAQRVEFLTQSCSPTLCTATYLQPACGQCSVPTIIKPTITPVASISVPPAVPCFPEFGGYPYPPPMPVPPFCMGDKDDDDWHHLLYFLIFALQNRGGCGNSCGGFGGNSGCGCGGNGCGGGCHCGCGGGCGCGCDMNDFGCYNINNNGKDVVYVPYPIAVPMNSWPSVPDKCSTPKPAHPSCHSDPNEINLIIRTESQSNSNKKNEIKHKD